MRNILLSSIRDQSESIFQLAETFGLDIEIQASQEIQT